MIPPSPRHGPSVNGCAANPTTSIWMQGFPSVFVGKPNSWSPLP